MLVRPTTPDDAHDVALVHVRSWQAAYAGIVPAEILDALDIDARAERLRPQLPTDPPAHHQVALDSDTQQILGFVRVGAYRTEPDAAATEPGVGEVYAIYLHPDHWGSGVGRALLSTALAELRAAGYIEARLWVFAANDRARRFYERAGFAVDGGAETFAMTLPGGGTVEISELRYARGLVGGEHA